MPHDLLAPTLQGRSFPASCVGVRTLIAIPRVRSVTTHLRRTALDRPSVNEQVHSPDYLPHPRHQIRPCRVDAPRAMALPSVENVFHATPYPCGVQRFHLLVSAF